MEMKKQIETEILNALKSGNLEAAKAAIDKVRKLNNDYQWVAIYADNFWATNEDWIVNNRIRTYPLKEVRIGFSGDLFCFG